jgi:hypothetical protein
MKDFYHENNWTNPCIAKDKIRAFENYLITKGKSKNSNKRK